MLDIRDKFRPEYFPNQFQPDIEEWRMKDDSVSILYKFYRYYLF